MTLAAVRAAALDRALVGDDPESALALAGVVDSVMLRITEKSAMPGAADETADPFTAAMLAVGCVGAASGSAATDTLDDRAWRPGHDADPAAIAGAAVAVRERGVAVDRAATLAGCAPATLDAVVEKQRREKEN
ncbi:hypothetical protein [Haloplanus aerogenes]|uniref:Uncharacterized protein n=1 Tax=Haloplanus aerogenes TaxID=660522 RepID=A0A3M0CZX8_9EURY|nr:hypothetical protein [Haloplanus aerogenes]AZH26763.1 hypothetical protein DU502_15870 [Haloplanus aerogenes]RMB13009.1 hypothetical protein ATH50_3167 [Haloplanus aerogenes]